MILEEKSQPKSEIRKKPNRRRHVDEIDSVLSLQIKKLRLQRGWSQMELARRVRTAQTAVSAWERPGVTKFTLKTLKRLAEVFDVKLVAQFAVARDSERGAQANSKSVL